MTSCPPPNCTAREISRRVRARAQATGRGSASESPWFFNKMEDISRPKSGRRIGLREPQAAVKTRQVRASPILLFF
jgi:hypothetical protein